MAFAEFSNPQQSGSAFSSLGNRNGSAFGSLTNGRTREQEEALSRFAASRNSGVSRTQADMAGRLGLPVENVRGAENEAMRADERRAFGEAQREGLTGTLNALSDDRVAQDLGDADTIRELSWIERRWRGVESNADAVGEALSVAPDLFMQGVGGLTAFGAVAEPSEFIPVPGMAVFGDPIFQASERLLDAVGLDFTGMREGQRQEGLEITAEARANMAAARESLRPGSERFIFDVVTGVEQSLMSAMVAVGLRSPTAGMAFVGGTVAAAEYADAINNGASENEARLKGVWFGLAEGLAERIPLGVIFDSTGKGLLKQFIRGAGAEAIQEGLTEFLQMGYDLGIVGEEMTFGEAAERIGYAMLVGGAAGGPVASVGSVANTFMENRTVKRRQAQLEMDRVRALREQLIPLQDRSPDGIQRFVSEAIESRYDGHVYIGAQQLLEQTQDAPGRDELLQSFGLTGQELAARAQAGEDIRITGDQFSNIVMSDTVLVERLLPHVMFGEYARSVAELDALAEQEAAAEEAGETAATDEEINEAADEITAEAKQEGDEGSRDPTEATPEEEVGPVDANQVLQDVEREQTEGEIGIPENVANTFVEMGRQQRGDPEAAMLGVQKVMGGGGVISWAAEHIGDLTHRATEMAIYGNDGFESFAPKVEKAYRMLTQKYGFLKEHKENLVSSASYAGVSIEEHSAEVDAALSAYAEAHKKMPAYNRLQWLSREAAIAIGEQKFRRATDLITELHDLVQDADAYHEAAFDFQTDDEGQIEQYDPDAVQTGDPAVDGPVTLGEHLIGLREFFKSARDAAMSAKEYRHYLSLKQRVGRNARTKMQRDILAQEKQRLSETWKDERAKVREEVAETVMQRPMYRLMKVLGDKDRLDRAEVEALMGEGFSDRLPLNGRKKIVTTKSQKTPGVSVEHVAQQLGYANLEIDTATMSQLPKNVTLGAVMLHDLANNWVAPEAAIERATEIEMNKRHGNILESQRAIDAAIDYLRTDTSLEVIATEYAALERATSPKEGGLNAREITRKIKRAAHERVLDMRIDEIQTRRLNTVAKRHGERARRFMREGDRNSATRAKFQQLVAEAMAQEANAVWTRVSRDAKYMRRFDQKKKRFPKIEAGYVDQIRNVLAPFNLAPSRVSEDQVSKIMKDLRAWADKNGTIIPIPERVKRMRKKNWRDLTLREFEAVSSIVHAIEQQGIRVKQYRVAGELRQMDEVAGELVSTVEKFGFNKPRNRELRVLSQQNKHGWDAKLSKLAEMDAAFRKVELLLIQLDNNELGGPWVRAIFEPFSKAAARQADLVHETMNPLMRELEKLPGDPLRQTEQIDLIDTLGRSFRKSELIAMALNTGNVSNFNKMIEGQQSDRASGFVWDHDTIINVLETHLTKEELAWVQKVWDSFEEIRPFVEEVYEREYGVAPTPMEAMPRTINGVEMKGGYFPMVYDHSRGEVKDIAGASNALEAMQRVPTQAAIFSSFTNERTNYSAPVDLNLTNVPRAIQQHLYYVTHYEASRDVSRLLSRTDVQRTIRDNLGEEYFDAIRNWVSALNTAGYSENSGNGNAWVYNLTEALRQNTSVAVMGLSYTTLISQVLGLSTSVGVLGQKKGGGFSALKGSYVLARGIAAYLNIFGRAVVSGRNPFTVVQEQFDAIYEMSGEMRHRLQNTERELSEVMTSLRADTTMLGRGHRRMQRFSMGLIGFAQLHSVDMPTWLGAYNQALREGAENDTAVQIADSAVRTSQSSGAMKDLPQIQRQKGVMRWLTMFSTYTMLLYGLQAQNIQNMGKGYNISTTKGLTNTAQGISRLVFLTMIPAMADMLLRAEWDDDEFEDDPLTWALLKNLSYSIGAIPLIGRFGEETIMSAVTGRRAGYNVAVQAIPESAVAAINSSIELLDGDGDMADVEKVVRGLGFVFGMPGTVQAARAFDALEGDGHWYHFLIGDPTDDK